MRTLLLTIVQNCLRLLAQRQHVLGRTLRPDERLQLTLARTLLAAAVRGAGIIITVYVPVLFLTEVEGRCSARWR